jgi:hypothetical protein
MNNGSESEPLLHQVAATCGARVVTQIVKLFGGRRLYIPARRIRANSPLAALGQDDAGKLVEMFGGTEIEVPIGHASVRAQASAQARVQIRAFLLEDHPEEERVSKHVIAQRFGVSPRTVQRIRAELRKEKRREALRRAFERDAPNKPALAGGRVRQLDSGAGGRAAAGEAGSRHAGLLCPPQGGTL